MTLKRILSAEDRSTIAACIDASGLLPLIQFVVPGEPVPQGSHKAFVPTNKADEPIRRAGGSIVVNITNDNPDTRTWKKRVAGYAGKLWTDDPLDEPIRVSLAFVLSKPKSVKRHYPEVKPDLDKLIRAVFDACTGLIWVDDSRIVDVSSTKAYGFPPGVTVRVWRMRSESQPSLLG